MPDFGIVPLPHKDKTAIFETEDTRDPHELVSILGVVHFMCMDREFFLS
jgi:hypothetical protein